MELYDIQKTQQRNTRIRIWKYSVWLIAGLALVGCIVCCCLSSTATAAKMELYAFIMSTLAGWFVIFAITVKILPLSYACQHECNMLEGPRDTVTGVVALEPEELQIPKSIAICKVMVSRGMDKQRLSIRADKARLIAAREGRVLTLHTVHGYIAAFEEANENT